MDSKKEREEKMREAIHEKLIEMAIRELKAEGKLEADYPEPVISIGVIAK